MTQATGAIIREARLARGWTQKQLAEAAGLSVIAVKTLEGGKHAPSSETLSKLATALHLSIDVLMGRGDYLAGDFPIRQLDQEGVTAVLSGDFLLRYRRLWGRATRDQRAWIVGHLRATAAAELWLRRLEDASAGGEPDSTDDPTYKARLIPDGI